MLAVLAAMMNPELLSGDDLLISRKGWKRKLSASEALKPIRIAVLAGSTATEVVDILEILLLAIDLRPEFYVSEYGRYFEDAVVDSAALEAFQPNLVYMHNSSHDLGPGPGPSATEADLTQSLEAELARFRQIWQSLKDKLGCQIIQNNFELPVTRLLGNLDAVAPSGRTRYVLEMNRLFAQEVAASSSLVLQDVQSLSASFGLTRWSDPHRYFSYKVLTSPEASVELARSLASLIGASIGRSRKVLVLDLDNTLWGGIIGDDGVDKLVLGNETALAEAYTAFQKYCLALKQRGVLLAVCSKNDDEVARGGFSHPDSVLKLTDFSAFRANWNPKSDNLREMAQELNLGLNSFVFVDDNPAERAIVQAQVPEVAVPNVGDDVTLYPAFLDAGRYFETVRLTADDLERAKQYANNAERNAQQSQFADYGEYLDSLEMSAEIARFSPTYLDRIAQLTNKSNQFNLTTRRYTLSEIEQISADPEYIGLYGRLKDRFGDNGLVSVVLGRKDDAILHLDLWLMSCRVLKREMEFAMLDAIVDEAKHCGITEIHGTYLPTAKNGMVKEHYHTLGFTRVAIKPDGESHWKIEVAGYEPRTTHIKILE
jgi:FkbH-like protein